MTATEGWTRDNTCHSPPSLTPCYEGRFLLDDIRKQMATVYDASVTGQNGHQVAVFGSLLRSYKTFSGAISMPPLEVVLGAAALRGDLRHDCSALTLMRDQFQNLGFSAAPGGGELVRIINELPEESLQHAGADFRNCVGLSLGQLSDAGASRLNPLIARLVCNSMEQLRMLLPDGCVILGPLEGTFRGQRGAISWVHLDENRTSEAYLQQALFPLPRSEVDLDASSDQRGERLLHHYHEVKAEAATCFPGLKLPEPSCSTTVGPVPELDLQALTYEFAEAVKDYNRQQGSTDNHLLLDFVNVWIPRDSKQIALLPLCHYARFRNETRPSIEEMVAAGFQDKFQAFSFQIPVMFSGRFVLHQAAEGPGFVKCELGSLETRYLVLMRQRSAHRFAGFRPSCLSDDAPPEMDLIPLDDVSPDVTPEDYVADPACCLTHEHVEHAEAAEETRDEDLGDEPHLKWYLSLWGE